MKTKKNTTKVTLSEVREFITKNPKMKADKVAEKLGITIDRAQRQIADFKAKRPSLKTRLAEKGVYTNHTGVKKNEARLKIYEAIRKHISKSDILSLPSDNPVIENYIHKNISSGFGFDLVEYCPKVFKKLLAKLMDVDFTVNNIHKGAIANRIYKAVENQYAHLVLDYCGVLPTFAEEILYAIQNNIVEVNGSISVTLSKNGIGNKGTIIQDCNNSTPNFWCAPKETDNGIMTFFLKACGFNYVIEQYFPYHDTSAMVLIVIRRVK
jgi:hypothetical protein